MAEQKERRAWVVWLRSKIRPFSRKNRNLPNKRLLALEALEGRLMPAAVAPGDWWDDGYVNSQGIKSGVTVSLHNTGATWLSVTGGSGAVSVSPGSPPTGGMEFDGGLVADPIPGGGSVPPTGTTPPSPVYSFAVTGNQVAGSGDVTWSGAADSLSITATGDVSGVSISGNLYIQADWTIGNLSGKQITAIAGKSIGTVNASDDVLKLAAGTTISSVTAADWINLVTAGASVGAVQAGGSIASIQAGTTLASVTSTGWIGSLAAGLDITGAITAGLWIGGAYIPNPNSANPSEWQYSTYGAGINAGRDILGSITASKGIVGVNAGRDIQGNVTASAGDIWWVQAGGGGTQSTTGSGTTSSPEYGSGSTWVAYAPGNITGTISASRDIHTVSATGDVRGSVTTGTGFLVGVNAGQAITGSILAATEIGRYQTRTAESVWQPFAPGWNFDTAGYGSMLPKGPGVQAGTAIYGNVTATAGDVLSIGAGTTLGGSVQAGRDIGPVSSGGALSGNITASRDIGSVSSKGNISGTIVAGRDLAYLSAGGAMSSGGMVVPAGSALTLASVSGPVSVGRDLGGITVTVGLSGSVKVGRDLGAVLLGAAGQGGVLSGAISATGNIGTVTVLGTGGLVTTTQAVPSVENPPAQLISLNPVTGTRLISKPGRPIFASGGDISGKLTAGGSIGAITAFGGISGGVTAQGDLGPVWASDSIAGPISTSGTLSVTTWGGINNGDLSGAKGINLLGFATVNGVATSSAGTVRVESWDNSAVTVTGFQEVAVHAYAGIDSGTIVSQTGEVNASTYQGDIKANVTAEKSISTLATKGGMSGTLTSLKANVSTSSFLNLNVAIYANVGYVFVLTTGNYSGKIESYYDSSIFVRGNLNADVTAGGSVSVFAGGQITGNITARENDVQLSCKGFLGNATAGTNLNIQSWGDVFGTQFAKGDVDAFVYGNLIGSVTSDVGESIKLEVTGNLSASVTGDLSNITARVFGDLKGDLSTKTGKIDAIVDGSVSGSLTGFQSVQVEAWGNLTGPVKTIPGGGLVELVVDGNVTGNITSAADATLQARGGVTGKVQAGVDGIAQNEDGSPRTYDARVEAFGNVNTEVAATGKVTIGSYQSVSGTYSAGQDLSVTAIKDINGIFSSGGSSSLTGKNIVGQVNAQGGNIQINAFASAQLAASAPQGAVDVYAGTTIQGTFIAGAGASLTAGEDVLTGSQIKGGLGNASVSAGKTITATVSGLDVDVSAGQKIQLLSVNGARDVSVTGLAAVTVTDGISGQDFKLIGEALDGKIVAGRDFSGQGRTFSGSVGAGKSLSLVTLDSVSGSLSGLESVSVTTLGTGASGAGGGAINATLSGGAVTADSASTLSGSISATGAVFARANGTVSTPIASSGGDVEVVSFSGEVSGNISSAKNVTVTAKGTVAGNVEAKGGNADIWSIGDIAGKVSASQEATVTSWGTVRNTVSAGSGSATIYGNNGVLQSVTAGQDASVSTGPTGSVQGSVSAGRDVTLSTWGGIGAAVIAGRDADVWAKDQIQGSVTAGGTATVSSMAGISGFVSAGLNAVVEAVGPLLGYVAATSGSATVTTWQTLNGPVTAGTSATVWAFGDINDAVTAGTTAQVDTWGILAGKVQAVGDATVWAAGNIIRPVQSGSLATVTTWGNLEAKITAGSDLSLWVRNKVNADAVVGNDLSATLLGGVTSGKLSAGRDAVIFSNGNLGGTGTVVSAQRNVTVSALGNLAGGISAGQNADVSVVGTVTGNVSAGQALILDATGNISGVLTSGTTSTVSTFGAFLGHLTAGGNADVWAFGNVNGDVTSTTANASIVSWGDWDGTVTAGVDAIVFAYGAGYGGVDAAASAQVALGAGGDVEIQAGLDIDLVSGGPAKIQADAGQDLFVTVNGNALQFQGKAARDASVLAFGDVYGSLAAGNDASLVFTGGSSFPLVLNAGRDAYVWSGKGFSPQAGASARSIQISAARDAVVESWGPALDIAVSGGRDSTLWARGNISGDLKASTGSAWVGGYGDTLQVGVNAGVDASVGSLGALQANVQAGGNLDLFHVGTLSGTQSALGIKTDRTYSGTDPLASWLASRRATADAEFQNLSLDLAASRQEVTDWLGDLAAEKLTVEGEVSVSLGEASKLASDLAADLAVSDQGLVAARAQLVGDLAGLVAEVGVAYAAAAQEALAGKATAEAELAAAANTVEAERASARAEIATEVATAAADLSVALQQMANELLILQQDLQASQAQDLVEAGFLKNSHMLESQQHLVDLSLTDSVALWDEMVQQKINDILDYAQMAIGLAEFIPRLGSAASGLNALISLLRGHYGAMALAALGTTSGLGKVSSALRLTRFGVIAANRIAKVVSAVKNLAVVLAKAGKTNIYIMAARTGSPLWRATYRTYDFIFCKTLKLACFTAGTPIQTELGPKAIETIQVGDRVWSRDESGPEGALELKEVEEVFERWAMVLKVALPGGVEIGTTIEHPFWVVGKGWINAGELQPGDRLIGQNGREIPVLAITETQDYQKVYNFRVADFHTYYVGGPEWGYDVWAHNACLSQKHHPVFKFILRALRESGFMGARVTRLPRQNLVRLSMDAHMEQVHKTWDILYPNLAAKEGAARRLAEMLKEKVVTAKQVFDLLENFYPVALRDYPEELFLVMKSLAKTRGKLGV